MIIANVVCGKKSTRLVIWRVCFIRMNNWLRLHVKNAAVVVHNSTMKSEKCRRAGRRWEVVGGRRGRGRSAAAGTECINMTTDSGSSHNLASRRFPCIPWQVCVYLCIIIITHAHTHTHTQRGRHTPCHTPWHIHARALWLHTWRRNKLLMRKINIACFCALHICAAACACASVCVCVCAIEVLLCVPKGMFIN